MGWVLGCIGFCGEDFLLVKVKASGWAQGGNDNQARATRAQETAISTGWHGEAW